MTITLHFITNPYIIAIAIPIIPHNAITIPSKIKIYEACCIRDPTILLNHIISDIVTRMIAIINAYFDDCYVDYCFFT